MSPKTNSLSDDNDPIDIIVHPTRAFITTKKEGKRSDYGSLSNSDKIVGKDSILFRIRADPSSSAKVL
jgi:hypothetical protein